MIKNISMISDFNVLFAMCRTSCGLHLTGGLLPSSDMLLITGCLSSKWKILAAALLPLVKSGAIAFTLPAWKEAPIVVKNTLNKKYSKCHVCIFGLSLRLSCELQYVTVSGQQTVYCWHGLGEISPATNGIFWHKQKLVTQTETGA